MYFFLRLLSHVLGRIHLPASPLPSRVPGLLPLLDWIFAVPSKNALQQNKAEEAALVRLIVEAIAEEALTQRIKITQSIRCRLSPEQKARIKSCSDCQICTQ